MGSGHALDALLRLKNNRALKQMSKFGYSQFKDVILNTKSKYHHFVDRNKLSEKELILYKRKIRKKIIAERIKTITKHLFISLIIIAIIFTVLRTIYIYLAESDFKL